MTDVERGTHLNDVAIAHQSGLDEGPELGLGHPVALDRELVFRVAFVSDVVRWICENHVGFLAGHEALDVLDPRGVTAQHSVWPKNPEVSGATDWCFWSLWR